MFTAALLTPTFAHHPRSLTHCRCSASSLLSSHSLSSCSWCGAASRHRLLQRTRSRSALVSREREHSAEVRAHVITRRSDAAWVSDRAIWSGKSLSG
eukprot:923594-Prymnesium_polylepis.1